MLQTLQIENFALVDSIHVEFEHGLNIMTGETGAGKSIIVGALSLLLGERADKTMIRQGEKESVVEAAFQLDDSSEIDAVLAQSGVETCTEGHLIIRRLISAGGAGRQFINNTTVTIQVLKKTGELLVDMHGPHDHQSLLSPDFQLRLLDSFGGHTTELQAYSRIYDKMQTLQQKRRLLDADDKDIARQIDMISFQVKELEQAKLDKDEEKTVLNEHTLLGNAHRILQLAGSACNALTDDDASAFNSLVSVQKALEELGALAESAAAWKDDAQSIAVQIQELHNSINSFAQNLEVDPSRLQWLDERLAVYQKMKRKYGGSVAEILRFFEQSKEQIHDLQMREEQLVCLDAELSAVRKKLEKQAQELRKKRQSAVKRLVKAITHELQDLGFSKSAFSVQLHNVEPCASGMDAVEFGFAPNTGEAARPFRAIVSSGEMSRVMLAVKAVLAEHDCIPVLVFDEIDVNIGGQTANAVGLKLAGVAKGHQVLCITHLPQVAVYGATQYAVAKETRACRTMTRIFRLDQDKRIEEIARMLGGRDMTSVTLDHAREMLQKAK